jgi:adenine C2-methylase RlmN of 23S rRNA A2503 and tRNA A37
MILICDRNFLLQNKNASLSDLVVLTEFCRQQLQHINSIPYEPFLRGKFEFLPLDQMKLSW